MNEQSGQLLEAPSFADQGYAPTPSLERRRLRAYAAMVMLDVVLIHVSFGTAALFYEGHWWDLRTMVAAKALLPLYLTIALYSKAYSAKALSKWVYGARKAVLALVIAAVLLNLVAFYAKTNAQFSRASITIGLVLAFAALIAFRRAVPLVIDRLWQGRIRNELVIEDGGPDLVRRKAKFIKAKDFALDPKCDDPIMLDRLGNLFRNQDRVVITCPLEKRAHWLFLLKSTGAYGEIISASSQDLGAVGAHHYGAIDQTVLVVSNGPLGLRARMIKRLFDSLIACAVLIALAPFLALIAAAIKLEDGGPIFFFQRRQGKGNCLFDVIKFRTMRVDVQDPAGVQSTSRNDARVTRCGDFLRGTSLDELPQLLNVLKGDMSLVGPRPHAVGSRVGDTPFWMAERHYPLRHSLKPGMTGLAQVRGFRGATHQMSDLTDRLHADLEYIANWSLMGDVVILLKTLTVMRHQNAY
ncbi:MAG: sugar transferase [Pseudomonadota bacterium]